MAESVDALVSNTSGATRAGSTPALGTKVPRVRLKRRTGSKKATRCKTITYSAFSFYKTKDFSSKFSPHFPHRCKFDAIEWEILRQFYYIMAEMFSSNLNCKIMVVKLIPRETATRSIWPDAFLP